MFDFLKYCGPGMAGGGVIFAMFEAPDAATVALTWGGAAVTAAVVAWPKVKSIWTDYRATEREQEAADFQSYKQILLSDLQAVRDENAVLVRNNAELLAKVELLSRRVEELTTQVESLSTQVAHPAPL
ncbi:hypothetical protein [Paludisphaera rhizosphaerae]|uniref:hypothetical protein n=1 Tax=Paludisphaera rhizosphaerae TaxID=2711216 RepID=UPI0013ED87CD|nr:hypothetical protein [Paludisphaera rhizosphaerae]